MDSHRIIKGRLIDRSHVELSEPAPMDEGEVEVRVTETHPQPDARNLVELVEWLRSLPMGRRSKEDIDAQIKEERSAWREL